MRNVARLLLVCLGLTVAFGNAQGQHPPRPPIIDMHLHALSIAGFAAGESPQACSDNRQIVWFGWDPQQPFPAEPGSCPGHVVPAPRTDEELLHQTMTALERFNIRLAVTAGLAEEVAKWRAAAPGRILPALSFLSGRDAEGRPLYHDVANLRRWFQEGRFAVFAEVAPQYDGMSPADPALAPFFALAEELDIPVGLHLGEGPPGGPNFPGYGRYRVRMGSPMLLEDVLARHPRLRLYVMHFGSPLVDEMIAILYSYPQVYVDVAQNNWGFPRKQFHDQLRRLVEAGYGKRIMFGSDQMLWPHTIGLAIETIESADFLTAEQKRDIFCHNAARFLRLPAETCD